MPKSRKQFRYSAGVIVWFSAALYYLYQYILRVSPMVMVDPIRFDFDLDAASFGTLMAITTFMYSAFQIPIGILSDLFNARRMILLSLMACVAGTALFGYTENLFLAYIARILIGMGSAAAFICVSKISSDWFPIEQKSLWFAAAVMMGTTGAVLGGKPLAQLVTDYGWRETLGILTWVGVGILVINFIFLRNKQKNTTGTAHNKISDSQQKEKQSEIKSQIMEVFFSKACWIYAFVGMGMYLSISVFADLWGVSFFQEKYGVAREAAAQSISMTYYGTCAGVLSTALLSHYIKNSRMIIGGSALMVSTLMAIIVFSEGLGFTTISLLMIMVGFFAGGEVLCFSESCKHMSVNVAATVTGFLNFVITLGGAIMQKGFGSALDWFWDGQLTAEGTRFYSVANYKSTLLILILVSLLSFVLAFFLPDDVKSTAAETKI